MRHRMQTMIRDAQSHICDALEALEAARFVDDPWLREEGGGGSSRILEGGRVVEKGGVNVAAVWGNLPQEAEQVMLHKPDLEAGRQEFFAAGLSVVIHPRNPHAPTAHCNYRYFELADGRWWFGGGTDLTPVYLHEEDARHFHRVLQQTCDRHDPGYYPRFKRWCDEYFVLPHRGEARGVGGIFFDDLKGEDPEPLLSFVTDCAFAFVPAYVPLLERRQAAPHGEEQLRWQGLRRGRYVEFNLMYDRGTRFGLRTGGRVDSILMSLPPTARWEYAPWPPPAGPEAATLEALRHPREWV